jgi:hypothetical protein
LKRFLLIALLLFVILFLLALAFWYWTPPSGRDEVNSDDIAPHSETRWSFQSSGNEFTINGKKTVVEFVNADIENVELKRDNSFKIKDGHVYATYSVTIKGEQTVLLTRESYAKIHIGMTFPEVAEALGGSMKKGRMSDGFHGRLDMGHGKRQITVSFEDGKVTEKSAKDLE